MIGPGFCIAVAPVKTMRTPSIANRPEHWQAGDLVGWISLLEGHIGRRIKLDAPKGNRCVYHVPQNSLNFGPHCGDDISGAIWMGHDMHLYIRGRLIFQADNGNQSDLTR